MPRWLWSILTVAALLPHIAAAAEPISYNRDIRPILSNHCFQCHGFDAQERQAELRLDVREDAVQPAESGATAIVPGKPEASELVRRIMSHDADVVMPPPETKKSLSEREQKLLAEWIRGGAAYQIHWAFIPPARAELPSVKDPVWSAHPIDRFIAARLEAAQLAPQPAADRETLIRRATLDLTGLPPTIDEIDAFLADREPGAYERVIDRLLASPHYGERMALEWLDAARYADTHGYHIDSGRDMTLWRKWVIEAYNQNLPFDQFTIQQLAGDLLPAASLSAQIASGFHRNHMINFEGGAIPDEYHAAYIIDRVNTTATVWLGLTIGCAQCHDHKYDPITQREYYELYAFFHNVPEKGLDGSKGNAEPLLRVPTAEESAAVARVERELAAAEAKLVASAGEIDAAQAAWEAALGNRSPVMWTTIQPLESRAESQAEFQDAGDGSLRVRGENRATDRYTFVAALPDAQVTAIRLETLPDEPLASRGPGRSGNGNFVLTECRLALETAGEPSTEKPLAIRKATADFEQKDFPIAATTDGKAETGWAIFPEVGKPHAAVFELAQPLEPSPVAKLKIVFEFQSKYGQHQPGRVRLAWTSTAEPHSVDALPPRIRTLLSTATAERTAAEQAELKAFYRQTISPLTKSVREHIAALQKEREKLLAAVSSTMVMRELPQPRETRILMRGQYDQKGDRVTPGVPAILSKLPAEAPPNRLGLAQWLVDGQHPLVARVTVNRYWQMYFGTGLVKTSDDFGSQGEWPSHPELLDWLATEFVASGWDVKALQRLIVSSRTYQQASRAPAASYAHDPENRLLGRAARFRLPAEFIRDQALATSGLLQHAIGGKSVSPYQPPGLWEELASRGDGYKWTAQVYKQDHGDDLYRRTMYTFWKRTSPPAALAALDAPDRETCTVRRARTNTPLQALVLMNDPTYVEAARKLAERLHREAETDAARLEWLYRLVLARRPTKREGEILATLLAAQRARFAADAKAAEQLLKVGEAPRDPAFAAAEIAAWTIVASTVLNLDEALTKG